MKTRIQIKSIRGSVLFESEQEDLTPRDTQDFKRIHAVYEAYKAYYNVMQGERKC